MSSRDETMGAVKTLNGGGAGDFGSPSLLVHSAWCSWSGFSFLGKLLGRASATPLGSWSRSSWSASFGRRRTRTPAPSVPRWR